MKLKKIIRKIVMSAAAALLAAAMTVTSFAANPENLPTGSGGTLPGTINVTPGTVTPGQIYTLTTEKEDRSGTKYQPGKYTNNIPEGEITTIPEGERTTIHFKLANDSMASGTMKDYIAAKNSSFQLPECAFKAKKGYSFARYVGFGENSARPGEYISIGDANEYWVWACFEPIEYATIRFYPVTYLYGKMESVKVEKGSKFKLPESTFMAQFGWDFDYWSTPLGNVKPGYSIQIGSEDEYKIYAKPKKVGYANVILDNGLTGSKHESYKAQLTIVEIGEFERSAVVTLPKPKFKAVEGYKFNNWTVGKPGEKCVVGSVSSDNSFITSTPVIYAEPEKTKVKMSECTIKVDYSVNAETGNWNAYTGNKITPIYTVTNKYGITLKEGVDFKASYSDNVEIGMLAKITVKGINGNTGTKKEYFEIKPPEMKGVQEYTLDNFVGIRFNDPNNDKIKQVEMQITTGQWYENEKISTYKWKNIYHQCDYGQRGYYRCLVDASGYEKGQVLRIRARYYVGNLKGEWTMRTVKVK